MNPWIAHVNAFRAAHPGMSYKDALKGASATYVKVPGAKPSRPRSPKARKAPGPRAKLAPGLHSCAGLSEDPCMVAPNCYWKPSKKVCATRSGAQVKQRMQGKERKAMLAEIRGQPPQQAGGYWW